MLVAIVLIAVLAQVGEPSFSRVEVEAAEVTAATMEVDMEVTLNASEGPAVAHFVLPGEAQITRPMIRRSGNRWGVMVELRRADWRVALEDAEAGTVTTAVPLTDHGLDPALLGVRAEVDSTTPGDDPGPALPLAVATFAAVLVALGVWALFRPRTGRHLAG